ncbi:MAG: peptidase BlaR1 [Eubacterium sp.]|nr:peptidase BlaR1 [Eubacterium sp.]
MIPILINLYNQLFVMSIVAIGLYLILKLFSTMTMRYFSSSWHYYTYIGIYIFLLLPYHKLLALFHFSINKKLENDLALPALPPITSLPLFVDSGLVSVSDSPENVLMLNLDFLPYFLMAGTLVFIAAIVIQNIRLHRLIFGICRLTNKTQLETTLARCKQELGLSSKVFVYVSPVASTPFLYGILKPCIILPDIEFTDEELQHIYFHELTHWKYHDPWLKILLLFINALHWFNPLAYIARRDINHLCELSCDEKVVKPMNNEERRRYCELLLNVLWNIKDHNTKLLSAFSDKRNVERRIDMILQNHNSTRMKLISVLAAVTALVIMSLGAVTAYAASNDIKTLTEEQIQTTSDITDGLSILDTIISARKSSEAVNKIFDNKNEIFATENDVIYYSKIYNSFEETKKVGEKSFYINHDAVSGYVALMSVYRISGTDKFIANYVGNLSK